MEQRDDPETTSSFFLFSSDHVQPMASTNTLAVILLSQGSSGICWAAQIRVIASDVMRSPTT